MTVLVSSQLSIPLNLMVDIVRADIYIFFHLSLLLRSQTVTSNSIIVFLLVLLPKLLFIHNLILFQPWNILRRLSSTRFPLFHRSKWYLKIVFLPLQQIWSRFLCPIRTPYNQARTASCFTISFTSSKDKPE